MDDIEPLSAQASPSVRPRQETTRGAKTSDKAAPNLAWQSEVEVIERAVGERTDGIDWKADADRPAEALGKWLKKSAGAAGVDVRERAKGPRNFQLSKLGGSLRLLM